MKPLTNTPILAIQNLSKTYDRGKTHALQNVSFAVERGEFVVVIGSSGAGKSTLVRCINRLVDPTSGAVVFDGENICDLPSYRLQKIRSQMGMVFQHYQLIGSATVYKNVLHGRLGHVSYWRSLLGLYSQADKKNAHHLIDSVGLGSHTHKKATTLSGGQMQRVGICRALMQEPKLLLADEPIASLDPTTAEVVMTHLKQATHERGLACICNLHQVDFAKRYATRIIGMKAGQVVFDGTPQALSDEMIAYIYGQSTDGDEGESDTVPTVISGENALTPPVDVSNNHAKKQPLFASVKRLGAWFAVLAMVASALFFLDVSPWHMVQAFPDLFHFFGDNFWPANFTGISANTQAIVNTLLFAVVATYVSSGLAFIMALFMTRHTNPFAPVRVSVLGLMSLLRNVPMLIWATLLVFIFGIGNVVGVVALIFTTLGFLARSYAETISELSTHKLEGIRSTGASYLQVLTHGLLPEFTPAWLNWTLFTLEVNMRASAVLGMVGAGGLGLLIQTTLDWRHFRRAMALVMILVGMVLAIELLCHWLRERIQAYRVKDTTPGRDLVSKCLIALGLGAVFVLSYTHLELDIARFVSRFDNARRIMPLLMSWNSAAVGQIVQGLLTSVAIAVAGLFFAFVVSIPLAFLAAKNTAPFLPLAFVIRTVVAVVRAVPSLVLILMLVASLGFGYTAGVMGLFFAGTAYLTKAFMATIEEQDPAIIETMRSLGASWLQMVTFGMLPQVWGHFVSWVAIRFESNVGDAVSLGVVGAGGIGMLVSRAVRQHDFATLATALVFIFVVMFGIELVVGYLKRVV